MKRTDGTHPSIMSRVERALSYDGWQDGSRVWSWCNITCTLFLVLAWQRLHFHNACVTQTC